MNVNLVITYSLLVLFFCDSAFNKLMAYELYSRNVQ